MSMMPPSARTGPAILTSLFAPVARMVILPPGRGVGAAARSERSCPLLATLMATTREPAGADLPLVRLMLPPLALRRRGGAGVGDGVGAAASFDETWMRLLTETVPPLEL